MAQGEPPHRCYRTIRLQNFKDIHNVVQQWSEARRVVIELLDYKISKTYTTNDNKECQTLSCYRTIRLQNFKDKESLFQKDAAKVQLFFEIRK